MAWLGFWIFMSALMVCDTWLFSQGYDAFFWTARTDAEKEIQALKIEKLKKSD